MIIANPIYDVAFKRLLENDRTANDAETRKELDLENAYLKSVEEMFGEQLSKIAEQAEMLKEKDAEIAELKRLLSTKG